MNSISFKISRVAQIIDGEYAAISGDDPITPRQILVLSAVRERAGLSQTDLVEQTGIDRSTLADIARRLLKKGLITRRRTKEDARTYAIKLGDDASESISASTRWLKKAEENALDVLSAAEVKQLTGLLSKVIEAHSSKVEKRAALAQKSRPSAVDRVPRST